MAFQVQLSELMRKVMGGQSEIVSDGHLGIGNSGITASPPPPHPHSIHPLYIGFQQSEVSHPFQRGCLNHKSNIKCVTLQSLCYNEGNKGIGKVIS